MPSMLYSVYPTRIDTIGHVPSNRHSIAEILAAEGWATAGFHSNPYLSRAYGFDKGFETFEDGLPLATNRIVTFLYRIRNHFFDEPYVQAKKLNQQALSWLSGHRDQSTFIWLHYMDPHGPYQPPAEYQQLFRNKTVNTERAKQLWRRSVDNPKSLSEKEVATLTDLYDAEIRYTDAMIGELLNGLNTLSNDTNTLVAIASDHGELFGEHDEYGHPRRVYEELVHVPLAIIGDGISTKRIQRPVENVDIVPTLLASVDLDLETTDATSDYKSKITQIGFDGRSLHKEVGDRPAFSFATGEGNESDRIYAALRYRSQTAMGIWTSDYSRIETVIEPASHNKGEQIEDDGLLTTLEETLETTSNRVEDRTNSDRQKEESDRQEIDSVVTDRLEELGYR
jgi:arylsulfatase